MIRIFDLPGIPQIEARIHLNANSRFKGPDNELFDRVCEFLDKVLGFGIDTPDLRDLYFVELDRVGDDAFCARYLQSVCMEGCPVAWWRERGWDIADNTNRPLLCFDRISKYIECIQDGLGPKSKTEIEAIAWAARQSPSPRGISDQDRRRNEAFLSLGTRRQRKPLTSAA